MYPDTLFLSKHLRGRVLPYDAQPNCRQSICVCIGCAKDQEGLKHIHRGQLDFSLKEICTQNKGKLSLLLEINVASFRSSFYVGFINTRTDFSYGLLQLFKDH